MLREYRYFVVFILATQKYLTTDGKQGELSEACPFNNEYSIMAYIEKIQFAAAYSILPVYQRDQQ